MNIYFIGMVISMIIYVILGFVISKGVKNANDFYVAGRQAPTILIIGSLVASYCSTGMFMGDAGEAYSGFFAPMLTVAIFQIVGYVYGTVFFGRYLRRSEAVTIPEFFGKRFDSRAMRILSMATAMVTLIVYMLSIMQGIGTLMSTVTGVDYNLCIFLALITFTLLTITSGSKGVLITDTVMFGIFTLATVAAVFAIAGKAGGWTQAIQTVTQQNPALLSWSGDLSYFYPTGGQNMLWALLYGVVWMSVCMVGPWQSSRYLMAKNEHVVIRSSVWSAFGIFLLQFLIAIAAVMVHVFSPELESASEVLIWASMNVMPTLLGVVLLTGVLAAGISSATTFLSLIGSSVANDICEIEDDKKKIRVGRYAIAGAAVIVMVLAYYQPPAIFWIMYLGATVIACSWFPVSLASVWSKRITKTGAFCGMLMGFIGCASMKVYTSVSGASLPLYLDPFVVGLAANLLGMIIGSALTKVTPAENQAREVLFRVPESECDPGEMRRTKRNMLGVFLLAAFILVVLLAMWTIPYLRAIQ